MSFVVWTLNRTDNQYQRQDLEINFLRTSNEYQIIIFIKYKGKRQKEVTEILSSLTPLYFIIFINCIRIPVIE